MCLTIGVISYIVVQPYRRVSPQNCGASTMMLNKELMLENKIPICMGETYTHFNEIFFLKKDFDRSRFIREVKVDYYNFAAENQPDNFIKHGK